MAGLSLETSNKFGKLYVFTRLALLILILIQLILLVIGFITSIGHDDGRVGFIIWCIFVGLALFLGLLAAWREHFLCAAIFALIEICLAISGFAVVNHLIAIGTVLCLICSIGFAIMLYLSGSRDMNMPQIC